MEGASEHRLSIALHPIPRFSHIANTRVMERGYGDGSVGALRVDMDVHGEYSTEINYRT